jgi:hypothetical protein
MSQDERYCPSALGKLIITGDLRRRRVIRRRLSRKLACTDRRGSKTTGSPIFAA